MTATSGWIGGTGLHSDHSPYIRFTGPARLEKAINSLLGIVCGVAVDGEINDREVTFLQTWLEEHCELTDKHPYNELMPVVRQAIADGMLSEEEKADILWLCERLKATEFYDLVTADMQRLHAILGGIAADGVVRNAELKGLMAWLSDHEHLRTLWPYDEVDSIITAALADGRIDAVEHVALLGFFREFTALLDERTITNPPLTKEQSIIGVCAMCPEIRIEGSSFAFTGASIRYTRADFAEVVMAHGGTVLPGVSAKVDYLIIGASGNPCWAYACYGRKVEKAVELRRQGARLLLVHENDFHDALEDRN